MKTFWTEETVNRKADQLGVSSHDWLLRTQHRFETETGVKWSVSHQGGGYQFDPVDEGVAAMSGAAFEQVIVAACKLLPKIEFSGYVTYQQVAQASGVDLRMVMAIVKDMEKRGYALRTVNRMGKGYAFKLVEKRE